MGLSGRCDLQQAMAIGYRDSNRRHKRAVINLPPGEGREVDFPAIPHMAIEAPPNIQQGGQG
jgi:hypothetical protein